MRRALPFALLLAIGGCKLTDQNHCRWRGEHVFCAASFPDAPYCSPCEPAAEMNGCVAEPPSDEACPDFEPPATSEGGGSSSSSSDASSSDETTAATMPATESTTTSDASSSSGATTAESSSSSSESSGSSGG